MLQSTSTPKPQIMHFSNLEFFSYNLCPGATRAKYVFENNWEVSVLAGPEDSGLYGDIKRDTFEVAIIRPNGDMLHDVLQYQTPVQVSSLMRLISFL